MTTKYEVIDFNSAFDVSGHIVGDESNLDNPVLTWDTQQPWIEFLETNFTGWLSHSSILSFTEGICQPTLFVVAPLFEQAICLPAGSLCYK
jgi:hypothetical protein